MSFSSELGKEVKEFLDERTVKSNWINVYSHLKKGSATNAIVIPVKFDIIKDINIAVKYKHDDGDEIVNFGSVVKMDLVPDSTNAFPVAYHVLKDGVLTIKYSFTSVFPTRAANAYNPATGSWDNMFKYDQQEAFVDLGLITESEAIESSPEFMIIVDGE
jgi:hypothetical protein